MTIALDGAAADGRGDGRRRRRAAARRGDARRRLRARRRAGSSTLHGPGDEQCAEEPVFARSVAIAGGGATGGALPAADRRVVAGPDFAPTRAGAYRWAVSYPGDGRATAPRRAAAARRSSCSVRAADRSRWAPPAEPAPAPGPGAPAEPPPARPAPALARFTLAARCVRPAASGRAVTLGLRLWTGRSGAARVRVERALGTGGRDRCPPAGSPGSFDGRYRTVATLRPALASASAARLPAPPPRFRRPPPPRHRAAEAGAGALPRQRHRRRRHQAALPARARTALNGDGDRVSDARDRGRRRRSAPCAPPRRPRARR